MTMGAAIDIVAVATMATATIRLTSKILFFDILGLLELKGLILCCHQSNILKLVDLCRFVGCPVFYENSSFDRAEDQPTKNL
jgi:hypothetical protein